MVRAAALALCLAGCTAIESTSELGVTVRTMEPWPWTWVSAHQADRMALELALRLHTRTPYAAGRVLRDVLPHSAFVWMKSMPNGVMGQQVEDTMYVVEVPECPEASAFAHELAHRVQQVMGSPWDPDRQHLEPGVWDAVNGREIPCAAAVGADLALGRTD